MFRYYSYKVIIIIIVSEFCQYFTLFILPLFTTDPLLYILNLSTAFYMSHDFNLPGPQIRFRVAARVPSISRTTRERYLPGRSRKYFADCRTHPLAFALPYVLVTLPRPLNHAEAYKETKVQTRATRFPANCFPVSSTWRPTPSLSPKSPHPFPVSKSFFKPVSITSPRFVTFDTRVLVAVKQKFLVRPGQNLSRSIRTIKVPPYFSIRELPYHRPRERSNFLTPLLPSRTPYISQISITRIN